MKITKCIGEGQSFCKRCLENGKWNRMWCCFLYKIEGYDGCYCSDCVKEIQEEVNDK
nr:MAG TPA: FhuF 2Fe-2S C-terminal domain [Inoviridae sp.]